MVGLVKQRTIYLTGYRGTGKTTVGRLIAAELGCRCVDLDRLIEQSAESSIREIFESGGEAEFRDWESRCLERLAKTPTDALTVVALGGGAILREENRDRIRESGCCVWLTASPETLVGRIAGDPLSEADRPALTKLSAAREVEEMLAKRQPLYRESADHIVSTEAKSPGEIAAEILEWYGLDNDET